MMYIEILVAVNDVGEVQTIHYLPYDLKQKQKTDKFIKDKREDTFRKWQLSYVRATVPVPMEPVIEATEVRPILFEEK